jgi:uncharacterized protein (DUF433 family)
MRPLHRDEGRALLDAPGAPARRVVVERMIVDPRVHFGKPCVAGTRITVQSVLELINEGLSFEVIVQDYYPDLTIEDVRACVQYAIAIVSAEDFDLASMAG